MTSDKKIFLASNSPRRKELLERMGLDFQVISVAADEIKSGLPPSALTEYNSILKAKAAAKQIPSPAIVISADTVVSIEGKILGKPASDAEAENMLRILSGKKHTVTTGVCVFYKEAVTVFSEVASVFMRPISDYEITGYVRSGEPADKAGAYGVQGLGSLFITRIDGDFYTVMGLPVSRLYLELNKLGVQAFG